MKIQNNIITETIIKILENIIYIFSYILKAFFFYLFKKVILLS